MEAITEGILVRGGNVGSSLSLALAEEDARGLPLPVFVVVDAVDGVVLGGGAVAVAGASAVASACVAGGSGPAVAGVPDLWMGIVFASSLS